MEAPRIVQHRGKWVIRLDGNRYSTGYDASEENRDAAERKASAIAKALTFTPQGDKVGDIMRAYLNDKHDDADCVDPDRLSYAWKVLEPHFGDLMPEEVDRKRCRAYHKARKGRRAGTINKELRTLRTALNWHLNANANPAQFEFLPGDEPRDRWITKEEFQHLLSCCSSPHLVLFIHLAIATAARKGAILDLTWMQIRWDRNEIWLGRKHNGKKRATVPMTDSVKKMLEEAKAATETDHVIEYAGEPVKDVRHAFNRACDKAGISNYHIHDIRHTAAVWMCGDGVEMAKISTYLGHTRIDITMSTYAKYQPGHLQDAAAALEVPGE